MIVFHPLFCMLVMGPAAMLSDAAASPPTSGPPPERLTGRARELASECSAVRWDTSTLLRGMSTMQETLAAMQATLANQATELAAVRSELTSVRAAAARAELAATRAARLGTAGEAAATPNPEDMVFIIKRLEDIGNSQGRLEREVKEMKMDVRKGNAADTAQDTRGWWELGLELGGFLQQREFSVYILVYAWANERGGRRLLYWLWAAAINPGMGCVWAVMVIGSWLQQAGLDAATAVRRAAAAARAWWRRSWLVRWLGCPVSEETNGEERERSFEMVSIGLHSQTAAPAAPTPPSFMDYLANTYSWMWGAQREQTPPANSTVLTHV
jgi:hypothetical protein